MVEHFQLTACIGTSKATTHIETNRGDGLVFLPQKEITAGHDSMQTDPFEMLQETGPSVLPQLESIIAELLPELLSRHSLQHWLQSDRLSFVAALQKFAITTLRYHYRSAAHLDLLKTVLAAMPDGEHPFVNLGASSLAW